MYAPLSQNGHREFSRAKGRKGAGPGWAIENLILTRLVGRHGILRVCCAQQEALASAGGRFTPAPPAAVQRNAYTKPGGCKTRGNPTFSNTQPSPAGPLLPELLCRTSRFTAVGGVLFVPEAR